MHLEHLWLADYRNYASFELRLPGGLLVVVGDNGAGKTNLLEAMGYLATLSSFRGATSDALVRCGAGRAIVRGEGHRGARSLLVEAEVSPRGRARVTVNRQPLRRAQDLANTFAASVFSPDDLDLVKGGPTGRRRYLDDTLVAIHPRHDAARRTFERVLRQRNALLAHVAGSQRKLTAEEANTLEVWDDRLVSAGQAVGEARADLVARLEPIVAKAYGRLSGSGMVAAAYDAPWRQDGLSAALAHARRDELRRGVTLVGPHRDDLSLSVGGLPARTHASQGEQRTLALSLRLAGHDLVTHILGEPPLLLLDDVFSELDVTRCRALLHTIVAGQTVITTTGPMPEGVTPDRVIRLATGQQQRTGHEKGALGPSDVTSSQGAADQ